MLALGGWAFGSKPFQELTENQFRMNGFVYDALEFLRTHEFDGLDIDWEVRSRQLLALTSCVLVRVYHLANFLFLRLSVFFDVFQPE